MREGPRTDRPSCATRSKAASNEQGWGVLRAGSDCQSAIWDIRNDSKHLIYGALVDVQVCRNELIRTREVKFAEVVETFGLGQGSDERICAAQVYDIHL